MTSTTPTAEEIKQVHKKTGEVHGRLKADKAFLAQFQADPIGTLVANGLPEAAAKELLTKAVKTTGQDEVSGYDYYVEHDIYYTDGSELIIRDWYNDYGVFLFEQRIAVD